MSDGCHGYYEPATGRIEIDASLSANGKVMTRCHEIARALIRRERHDGDSELSAITTARYVYYVENACKPTCFPLLSEPRRRARSSGVAFIRAVSSAVASASPAAGGMVLAAARVDALWTGRVITLGRPLVSLERLLASALNLANVRKPTADGLNPRNSRRARSAAQLLVASPVGAGDVLPAPRRSNHRR
jgi:hypothetical protein